MIRGTTPTFILTIDDEQLDLTTMDNVYVTIKQGSVSITKTKEDLTITAQEVDVFLEQKETLSFEKGSLSVQINFTYENGKRGCTEIARVNVGENLFDGVLA